MARSSTKPSLNTSPGGQSPRSLPARLSDQELLSALFKPLLPHRQSAVHAADMLSQCGGLRNIIRGLGPHRCLDRDARGDCWYALCLFDELFRRQLLQQLEHGPALTSPADTTRFLQHQLGSRSREVFLCLFLDTRHRVICSKELFHGSIDGASVHPRVVAEHALRHHAAAVIVAHNHPSGVAEPSLADQAITRRLKDALSLLEIRLLDHFVIGDCAPVSMAARGLL